MTFENSLWNRCGWMVMHFIDRWSFNSEVTCQSFHESHKSSNWIYNYSMMVNNSTNINKTNNHLSFQNNWTQKRPTHMTLEIQVLTWERHTNVTGLNWLMRSQPSPSLLLYLQWQHVYKQTIKNLHSKKPTHYHKNEYYH